MNEAELIIDLTQFVHQPARSGVQRVLVELVRNWPAATVAADIGYATDGGYAVLPLPRAGDALRSHFDDDMAGTVSPAGRLDQWVTGQVPPEMLMSRYPAYLLPEPSYRDDVLDVLRHWRSRRPRNTFAIFFDALPQTHPHHFRGPHQTGTSRYFREVSQVENVACISAASLDALAGRLRRRPAPNAMSFALGADAVAVSLGGTPCEPPAFVCVGTVEQRKNHPVILAAFDRLWRSGFDFHLHFIGAQGPCADQFLDDLSDMLAAEPRRFRWSREARDAEIHVALSEATAALFLSEAEGYGLPAVEALAAGCPIVAASSLPALEHLPAFGQMRLDTISVEIVAEAVQRVAEPGFNARLRQDLTRLRLPTWRESAGRLAQWIRNTLDGAAQATEPQGSHRT